MLEALEGRLQRMAYGGVGGVEPGGCFFNVWFPSFLFWLGLLVVFLVRRVVSGPKSGCVCGRGRGGSCAWCGFLFWKLGHTLAEGAAFLPSTAGRPR